MPRRAEQGHSAADEKGEQKKTGGADMAPKHRDRQKDRADKRGNDREEDDETPVVTIGNRARGQGKERKSGGEGKRVSSRVDLGGRGIIKKKKNEGRSRKL